MYLKFFNFDKAPFHTTPDPEFLFLSNTHMEAMAGIIYGVEQCKGIVAIIGQAGTGKKTLIRAYLGKPDRNAIKIINILNPQISFQELLQNILKELNQPSEHEEISQLISRLHDYLMHAHKTNYIITVIIDEAQSLPEDTLDQLRILVNMETNKHKLIQILLVGQPELTKTLSSSQFNQLGQRLALRVTILPLTSKESQAYIRHRLFLATQNPDQIFSRMALHAIIQYAKGIPRTINILCDNALLASYGANQKIVSRQLVKTVIRDYSGKTPSRWSWAKIGVGMLFGVGMIVFIVYHYISTNIALSIIENASTKQATPLTQIDQPDSMPPKETPIDDANSMETNPSTPLSADHEDHLSLRLESKIFSSMAMQKPP